MTMKNDTKIEEEFICLFKIPISYLTNFDLSTRKSRKFALKSAPTNQRIYV